MKHPDHAHRLDPEQLDPDALDPATYHRVIGPPLKVAADIAAKRGHPTLHDDMPAMLALVDMITRLADLFVEHYPDAERDRQMLDNAATGACVMVFQQAKLPADAIGQCLAALETAYRQLYEHDVVEHARPFVAMAWQHLDDDQRDDAEQCLRQAAESTIAAIEAWQTPVH